MEPLNQQAKTKGQGQWPDVDGVRFSDIGLGMIVQWGQVKGWAQGLFLFDNAPSHQKCTADTILTRNMVKGAC